MKTTKKPKSKQSQLVLPETLAQRILFLREAQDMTQRQLAAKAIVPLNLIEDLESGLELFLAPSIRLKIARALRVKPDVIEDVEKKINPLQPHVEEDQATQSEEQMIWRSKALLKEIQMNPNKDYKCPYCESPLLIRQFERRDLDDTVLTAYKIQCSQCLFSGSLD